MNIECLCGIGMFLFVLGIARLLRATGKGFYTDPAINDFMLDEDTQDMEDEDGRS
jgi:hypothetical protein